MVFYNLQSGPICYVTKENNFFFCELLMYTIAPHGKFFCRNRFDSRRNTHQRRGIRPQAECNNSSSRIMNSLSAFCVSNQTHYNASRVLVESRKFAIYSRLQYDTSEVENWLNPLPRVLTDHSKHTTKAKDTIPGQIDTYIRGFIPAIRHQSLSPPQFCLIAPLSRPIHRTYNFGINFVRCMVKNTDCMRYIAL